MDMGEGEVRRYLSDILPALADLADGVEARDLGEAAFVLRLMAHRIGRPSGGDGLAPQLSLAH